MATPSSAKTPNALMRAALDYAGRGWHVFPCHTPTEQGCSCRKDACEVIGKHPRTPHGLTDATTDVATIRRWWRQWPEANIALRTGTVSGFVVLDEDAYKGGDTSRLGLEQSYSPLPETLQQLTGGGGVHYFFAHPGSPVKNSVETLGPGLDIRGDGGYIIAPPSLHVSGQRYVWEVTHAPDDLPLAPCPAWLLALCQASRQASAVEAGAPIPSGQRNATLFKLGCSLRARGFAHPAILAALDAINTTQCQPPIQTDELTQIAASCATYQAGTAAQNGAEETLDNNPKDISRARRLSGGWQAESHERLSTPLQPWNGAEETLDNNPKDISRARRLSGGWQAESHERLSTPLQPWRELLLTKKNGDPTGNIGNIGLILANHPTWTGRFWWDAVRGMAMLDETPFTEELLTTIAQWLHTQERLALSTTRPLKDCLMVECHKQPRDLLQLWLNTLPPWDGVPRLSQWLSDVAGVHNDAYGQAVSRILPLSMVARAMQPGCLYRYVVILEGPENTGKSSLVHALATSEWCVDLAQALESKESHMIIQGAWLAELPELDSLSRTEDSRLKAFITLQEDRWIPKYSNYPVVVPRRTIFVGTTNEEGYLKGQTGNTRYLPLQTHAIDVDILMQMRDQLFAEALHVYREVGASWWHLSEEVVGKAAAQREQRRQATVYETDLQDWLEDRRFTEYHGDGPAVYRPVHHEVSWPDIAQWYLKIDREKWKDISLQKQIATSLKILGWHQEVVWRGSKACRVWIHGVSTFDL